MATFIRITRAMLVASFLISKCLESGSPNPSSHPTPFCAFARAPWERAMQLLRCWVSSSLKDLKTTEAKRGLGLCKLEENQVTSLRNDNLSEHEVGHPKYTTQSGNPKIDHRNYQSIGGQTQFWHLAMNHQWILGLHGFTSSLILKTQLGILSYIYITWG